MSFWQPVPGKEMLNFILKKLKASEVPRKRAILNFLTLWHFVLPRFNVISQEVFNNPQKHWIFPLLKCIVTQQISLGLYFLREIPGPERLATSGNSLKIGIHRYYPSSTKSESWGVVPRISVFMRVPARKRLGSTVFDQWFSTRSDFAPQVGLPNIQQGTQLQFNFR